MIAYYTAVHSSDFFTWFFISWFWVAIHMVCRLVGDVGDVSDSQNDTPKRTRKKIDKDLLKYLQETVNKKF
jgi:hypothetical protein